MMTSKVIAHKWWENTINVCVFALYCKSDTVFLLFIILYFSAFTLTFTLSAMDRSVCTSNCFWPVLWACWCSALTSRFAALRWLIPDPSWERSKSRLPRPSEYVLARLKNKTHKTKEREIYMQVWAIQTY